MFNFTDTREAINVTTGQGEQILNTTYLLNELSQYPGANVLYNQTEVREFHMMISGRDHWMYDEFKIEGLRCLGECDDNEAIEEIEISDEIVYWSNPKAWVSGAVPVEGDEAEVAPGVNMILDVSTPLLKMLTINGRLTFLNTPDEPQDLQLNTYLLYIRAGELIIGTEEEPFVGNATIKLHGMQDEETLTFSSLLFGGNKLMAIVNKVRMYGQRRDQISRLKETVFRGDTKLKVSSGLDWVPGDRLAIMPTATQAYHTDYATVQAYDKYSGVVTLDRALKFYHWGAVTSTASTYSGVDMRGEVIMLSRNIRIVGEDVDGWGAQIVIADNLEVSTGTVREADVIMDSVELFNCSQRDTYQSAIRFENLRGKSQLFKNSAIHGSQGWPMHITYAANVHVDNVQMVGGSPMGVIIVSSNNITIENTLTGDIVPRKVLVFYGDVEDQEACYAVCTTTGGPEKCSDIRLINNVASGCKYVGFAVPGQDCDTQNTQMNFRGNLAHSIDGNGAVIYPDPNGKGHSTCYSGSHFSAYKCAQSSVATHFKSQEIRMYNIVSIDNTLGVNLQTAGEEVKLLTALYDSIIYGESGSNDCPERHDCYCLPKMGFMAFGGNVKSKDPIITSRSMRPLYKEKSYGAFMPTTDIRNITFQNFFDNKTTCGAKQSVFGISDHDSDYIPPHRFSHTTFRNVDDIALAFIMDPLEEWHNPEDCAGFTCTAPSNVLLEFLGTKFEGSLTPSFRDSDFSIISDTPGASDKIKNCEFRDAWNAWVCFSDKVGVLVWTTTDEDWEDRIASPVYVFDNESGFVNKINSQMDHMWDGFYTGQKHKSQFASLVEGTRNYTVEHTGNPFKNVKWIYHGTSGNIKVKVLYWNAGSYSVYVKNKKIDMTAWNKEEGRPEPLTGYAGCGENRYVGLENYLEFMMTPGCMVEVKPVDAILSNVRLAWTLSEFYSQGGTTSFADRVSAALGIHASQIKVVAVYQGSVVVDYQIQAEEGADASSNSLSSVKRSLNALIDSNASDVFGAPVLSASSDGEVVVEDPDYVAPLLANVGMTRQYTTTAVYAREEEARITEKEKVTTIEEEETVPQLTPETKSLLGILGVLVFLFLCCAGCGGFILYRIKVKAAKQINKNVQQQQNELKYRERVGKSIDSSDVDMINMGAQYHPDDDQKVNVQEKRRQAVIKANDNVASGTQDNQSQRFDNSSTKLMNLSVITEQVVRPSVQPLKKTNIIPAAAGLQQ